MNIIKLLRVANDLTITELSKKSGLSSSYISELERDKKQVSLSKLKVLSNSFSLTTYQFMYFKELNDYSKSNFSNFLTKKKELIK